MALSTMNTSTVMTVVSLAILLQFRAVLSQFYSDSDLCPTPINATDETLTGAVMSQLPCSSDFSHCDVHDLVNISMDSYTYYGAISQVTISVSNKTKEETYYYILCSVLGDTNNVRLLKCLNSNESSFNTDLYWNMTGRNEVIVRVYNDSSYSNLVDCEHKTVLVANNSGLNLKVKVSQPKLQNIHSIGEPLVPIKPALVGPVCTSSLSKKHYQIGNLTFKSSVNFTNFTDVHFTYNFGDGHTLYVSQNHSNVSTVEHLYSGKGVYHYTVDALVVLEDDELAVHSSKHSNVSVYETLTEHTINVGRYNSVKVGVSDVVVTLSGSFPVKYCWCMVFPNSTTCSRVPEINSTSKGNITCITVLEPLQNQANVMSTVKMNFTMPGAHRIIANFTNFVDCKNESFTFNVYAPPSPVVIISSTTVGVLAALLAIVVVVIIVIVTVIIPYRRYKYRMTETANFRFVELSESTATIKGKVRKVSRNFADYFRPSKQDRVGLVNTESNDVTSSPRDRLINRNVATFTPYDSL